MQKTKKMTETMAHGYATVSTQRELSDEYQHDRVWMFFKNLCFLVLCTKVALALEGLNLLANRNVLHPISALLMFAV